MRPGLLLLPLAGMMLGCPVMQRLDTPVQPFWLVEPETGVKYRVYVPSYHNMDRDWPLVITLHGTFWYDGPIRQVQEWQRLAEDHGLIVAAPPLRSIQGITPVIKSWWWKDLDSDERIILALRKDMIERYRVDPKSVLLTGFSGGGYPMYYTGLRSPECFSMLVARSCNSNLEIFDRIRLTDAAHEMPIFIYWGKDDVGLWNYSWQAYRYLREHGCYKARKKEVTGGHCRRPGPAYKAWRAVLPPRHLRDEED